jgi:CIC family chloride channel protein
LAHSAQDCLPVVDGEQRLTGVIDVREIRRVLAEPGIEALVIASDLEAPAETLTPADNLLTAIRRMVEAQSDELVVVDEQDARRIVGTVSRSDVISGVRSRLTARIV